MGEGWVGYGNLGHEILCKPNKNTWIIIGSLSVSVLRWARESIFVTPAHTLAHHQQPIIEKCPGEGEILDEVSLKLQALICLLLYFPLHSFSPTEQININQKRLQQGTRLLFPKTGKINRHRAPPPIKHTLSIIYPGPDGHIKRAERMIPALPEDLLYSLSICLTEHLKWSCPLNWVGS